MTKNLRGLVLALAALAGVTTVTANADRLPTSPQRPTFDDCRALHEAFRPIKRQAEEAVRQCHRQEPRISPGLQVSWRRGCQTFPATRAWPQCIGVEQRNCQIGERNREEVQLCQRRARALAADPNEKRFHAALKNTNDTLDKINEAEAALDKTRRLLTDPSKFLYDSMRKYAKNAARSMFDDRGQLRPTAYTAADEMYRFTNHVEAAYKKAFRHPLLGVYNQAVVSALRAHRDWITEEARRLAWNIYTFEMDAIPKEDPARRYKTGFARIDEHTCDVLGDINASNRLRDSNEDAWLDLIGRCSD